MTLLFTAALIFLPDIGLWSLYKEKHLVKPPEAAEPQVGAKTPGSRAPRRGKAAAAPQGTALLSPLRGCGAPGSGRGRGAAAARVPVRAPRRREKVVRASEPAGLGFPGKARGEPAQRLPLKLGGRGILCVALVS